PFVQWGTGDRRRNECLYRRDLLRDHAGYVNYRILPNRRPHPCLSAWTRWFADPSCHTGIAHRERIEVVAISVIKVPSWYRVCNSVSGVADSIDQCAPEEPI